MDARALLEALSCPLIPVVVVDRLDDAVPLAEALLGGGISALEITLRTPEGFGAISAMKTAFPEAVIGAGTVCSSDDYRRSVEAGADFIVSPGASEQLFAAAAHHKIPFVPGAVTGSEVIIALEHGYSTLKFFPAETSGGAAAIRALSGPFPQVRFMPTGGITLENMGRYLELNSVCAVGGSWLTPSALLADQRWDDVRQLAENTLQRVGEINTEKHQ